jgi:hypothetical protein
VSKHKQGKGFATGCAGGSEAGQKGLTVENFRNFLLKTVILRDVIQFETVPIWDFLVFVPRGTFPNLGRVTKLFHVEQDGLLKPVCSIQAWAARLCVFHFFACSTFPIFIRA